MMGDAGGLADVLELVGRLVRFAGADEEDFADESPSSKEISASRWARWRASPRWPSSAS